LGCCEVNNSSLNFIPMGSILLRDVYVRDYFYKYTHYRNYQFVLVLLLLQHRNMFQRVEVAIVFLR
jgi:hypothetical protein